MEEQELNPFESPRPAEQGGDAPETSNERGGPTFSIGTLLLAITWIAIVLASIPLAPGVSVALAVLSVPAYVRVATAAYRHKHREKLTLTDKLFAFLGSFLIVSCLAISFGVCCFATCAGVFWSSYALLSNTFDYVGLCLVFSGALGVAVGGYVTYVLGKRIWPFRQRPFYETVNRKHLDNGP